MMAGVWLPSAFGCIPMRRAGWRAWWRVGSPNWTAIPLMPALPLTSCWPDEFGTRLEMGELRGSAPKLGVSTSRDRHGGELWQVAAFSRSGGNGDGKSVFAGRHGSRPAAHAVLLCCFSRASSFDFLRAATGPMAPGATAAVAQPPACSCSLVPTLPSQLPDHFPENPSRIVFGREQGRCGSSGGNSNGGAPPARPPPPASNQFRAGRGMHGVQAERMMDTFCQSQ
jgi:hypothetical protein